MKKLFYLLILVFMCTLPGLRAQNTFLGQQKHAGGDLFYKQIPASVIEKAKVETELRYDNNSYDQSMQIGNVAVAVKWDANTLTEQNGKKISKVSFYVGDIGTATFTVKIWEGANAETEVITQAASNVSIGWNEVVLNTPHPIDASKELWIGYDIVDGKGAFIPGYDDGTKVEGYSDLAYAYGAWKSMSNVTGNWMISAILDGEGTGGGETLNPPKNLQAEITDNNVALTWEAPDGSGGNEPSNIIRYDNDANEGSQQIGDMTVAIRWDAGRLTDYNNYTLDKVKFYVGDAGSATFTVKVWEGADASNELVSQAVTGVVAGWNEFTLDAPITIDGTKEYWIGYDIKGGAGGLIPGYDAGPAVDGYGNKVYYYGSWKNIDNGGNWNIAGYVSDASEKGFYAGAKALQSYFVYRDGTEIGQVSNTTYQDNTLDDGTYKYEVTAVYDDGESNPSEAVSVTIGEEKPKQYVIVEEGTGTWCSWCPRGTYAGEMLKEEFNNVIFTAVHGGDPMQYKEYTDAIPFEGFPGGHVQRTHLSTATDAWSTHVATISEQTPKVSVTITTSFDASTRELTATIKGEFLADLSGSYRLGGFIMEDAVTGSSSSYDQSNSYAGGNNGNIGGFELLGNPIPYNQIAYNHVMRQLLGGINGDANSLPSSISSGETHDYTYTFTLPETWNEEYIKVVGYVTKPDGKIENAGKSEYIVGNKNAKPIFINTPISDATVGNMFNYQVYCNDADNEDIEIFTVEKPTWITAKDQETVGIVHTKRLYSGLPPQAGDYTIKLGITDGIDTTYQEATITAIEDLSGSWKTIGESGFTSGSSRTWDVITGLDGTIYAAISVSDVFNVYFYNETNSTWEVLGDLNETEADEAAFDLASDGTLYLTYRNSSLSHVLARLNGTSWEVLEAYTDFYGVQIGFTLDNNDIPHIAMQDASNSYQGYCYRYKDGAWESLGNYSADFLQYNAGVWNKMATGPDGNVYVLWGDFSYSGSFPTVSIYDGENWVKVGGEPVSQSDYSFFYQNLGFGVDGTLFVSYKGNDDLFSYKFDGQNWVKIGDKIIGSEVDEASFTINSNGYPVATFVDVSLENKISTISYDGESWNLVGARGFSGFAGKSPIIGNQGASIYVCYTDLSAAEKATVKMFYNNFDASLVSLSVPDAVLFNPQFSPNILTYTAELPSNITEVPSVVYKASNPDAEVVVNDAADLSGTTTAVVTSVNGEETQTYSVNFTTFEISDDATLSSITIDGYELNPTFSSDVYEYIVEIPEDLSELPAITVITNEPDATYVINNAGLLGKEIVVTAEDGVTTLTYSIEFTPVGINYSENNQFKVYPNPATNYLNIETNSDMQVTIFNTLGQIELVEHLNSESNTINITNLSNGVYVVELRSENNTHTMKLEITR